VTCFLNLADLTELGIAMMAEENEEFLISDAGLLDSALMPGSRRPFSIMLLTVPGIRAVGVSFGCSDTFRIGSGRAAATRRAVVAGSRAPISASGRLAVRPVSDYSYLPRAAS